MADGDQNWDWSFRGYETIGSNCPVQDWFDGLLPEERAAIIDSLVYLQRSPIQAWKKPQFDTLEGGVSEVRGRWKKVILRIYGYFGPSGNRQTYTFLNGTNKKVRNDRKGKRLAKKRMEEIERREAKTHEFDFEEDSPETPGEGAGGPR